MFWFRIDTVTFLQQGVKLKVQNLKDPPFVTKLDPIIGSDGYDMEGPIPDIWFALQVGSITVDTFESILSNSVCLSFQRIMNFTYVVSEPPDMTFGALKPDGSWTGMIGELMNQNTDIGRVF